MALIGTLVDNFRASTLDTAKWNAVNVVGNSGFQAGGRYTFIVQEGATGDATLSSDVAYNLTGSHIHIHLIDAGVQEAGLETYPIILTQNPANQDNALLIVVSNGIVGIYQFVAGVGTGLAFPAYDATTMQWWRIRQSAGTVYFESAPVVAGPWTVRATVVPTIAITALYMKIRTFDFIALSTAKQTSITDVNYTAHAELAFPDGAIPIGMQVAFGADPSGDQNAWTWTDLALSDNASDPDAVMTQTVTVDRGRRDESSDVTPTGASIDLDNPSGYLTPDNAASPYYPNVDLGTPARWWIEVGTPRLYVRPALGANAQVNQTSAYDITGDLDVRVDLHLKTTDAAGDDAAIAGVASNTGEFGWRLLCAPGRQITLEWSDDGTPPPSSATSDVPVLPSSARAVLRVVLDINNGAGGHTVKWYLGTTITGPWTQIGSTFTGAGTTSVFGANEPLIIGSPPDLTADFALDADVHQFQLRNGIDGTIVANPVFGDQASGTPIFVDSVGLAWNVQGVAELSDRHFRIVGTIDQWTPSWPWGDLSTQSAGGIGVGQARVGTEIAGILRRLGQGQSPLQSALYRSITDETSLRAYWPMEDLKESTQIASAYPGGTATTFTGVVDFASEDTLLGSKPLLTLTATSDFKGAVVGTFSGRWQADWYINMPVGPATPKGVLRVTTTGTIKTWVVDLSAGSVVVTGIDAGGSAATVGSATPTGMFGHWTHLRLYAVQNGTSVDWTLKWFPVTYPATAALSITDSVAGAVGAPTGYLVPFDVDLDNMSMGHLAIFDESDFDASANAATGWTGDTAIQRMARLCTEEQVPLRIIGDPATSALVGPQQIDTLLNLLDDAGDADGGILYEQQDYVGLIYRTRDSLYNQPANLTLDALSEEVENPFSPVLDDQKTRNDITVTRTKGSSVQIVDQASIDKIGRYDTSVTLNLYSDTQVADAASWLLHQGTVPGMRYSELTSNLFQAPQKVDEWLTVDSGAKVVVDGLPPQHPTAAVQVIVEGYSEPVSPMTWEPKSNCSPASVWDVTELDAAWVSDTYLLRLETDGSILASAVDTDDTALSVTVTDGPAWVTAGGEFPLDIGIDGEQIRVTAIGAATASNQFTGAGNAIVTGATTSFVAPSVVAPASGDLLICFWGSYQFVDTISAPGAMTAQDTSDGTFTTFLDAKQTLGASGATGTRTATFGTADEYSAVSVVAHASSGSPTVQEHLGAIGGTEITLVTDAGTQMGWWLLAFQAWDWDPGNNLSSPLGVWTAVADSTLATATTSRCRAWVRRVETSGAQTVEFPIVGGITDNHVRLYVLSNIAGVTQAFTTTRSINGIVKSHAAGADVRLWNQPVLAR